MSRSRRHTPITGWTTAKSEKLDRRLAHRKLRKANQQILGETMDGDGLLQLNEVSSVWFMAKDGKRWIGPGPQDDDDTRRYLERLMRK